MSFAIYRSRGGGLGPISIQSSDLANVNSVVGTSATFSVDVGTGNGRTCLVLATIEDGSTGCAISSVTVDGTTMTESVHTSIDDGGRSDAGGIYIKKLTTESGTVNVVVTANQTVDSFGMSMLILENVRSETAEDTAAGTSTITTCPTSTTLEGPVDGIECGVAAFAIEGGTVTWGNTMTEQAEAQTGGSTGDHQHSVAYDLLSSARSMAVEEVTTSSSQRTVLVAATFR